MTKPARDANPRWLGFLLAAFVAALVTLFGAGTASAAAATAAQTRVGAHTLVAQVRVGPQRGIGAGQRLGNDHPAYDSALATGVAAEDGAGLARLTQDVAVNPSAPRALPLERPVGSSASQNEFVQSRIGSLQEQGARNLRVNQQQIDINGVRVGVNRPDLQYTLNGERYYEEFDTSISGRGPGHADRIGANDPWGIIKLFTVN